MNNKQLSKVLEMALPHYKAKLELCGGYGFICNEIKELWGCGALSKWQKDRALGAIKNKIAPEATLPNYFRCTLKVGYRPEDRPEKLVQFYKNWIAELKGEE